MSIQCPTCSRINPAEAAYCYYDGRGLNEQSLMGPLGLGTLPFSLPFIFADGHCCTNFNQLVLACDQRWGEARNYLFNGTWKAFFSAIGRVDLAVLAMQSANLGDPDDALCYLLERLPADSEALRPPKLALAATEEDLGKLEPGTDYPVSLVIENKGMLVLRGTAVADCDWLAFGGSQENATSKLFQTRDTYTLPVRVVGSKVRAGKQPLEGHIVIDTNGGRATIAVRATVPIRPFPSGPEGKNVLTGARSSREIAVKAKAHPQEAAVLFEQGAVKAWFASNGWAYPIRGTQARGKSALQQFFEALGLTKPPRLEIDTERIDCQGQAGQQLTKKIRIRTAEPKFVHAEALGSQDWIKVLPAQAHGNSVTVPLSIEVPPRPGETLHAVVTLLGNGQQQFVVPVALTVEEAPVAPKKEAAGSRDRWLWSIAGGVVVAALAGAITLVVHHHRAISESPPPGEPATVSPGPPRPGPPDKPVPKIEAWWDGIPGTHLAAAAVELKKAAGKDEAVFDLIAGKSEIDRRKGYEQLAAKLPELARRPDIRQPLGLFVTECCVYEPFELSIAPLVRGLAHQLPADDSPFPPGDPGEEIERASFFLQIVCDSIAHRNASPDRRRSLAGELANVLGAGLDTGVPLDELKDRSEKALAEQCYRNLVPTAEKSVEQALGMRQVLIARFSQRLKPGLRDTEDVKLLGLGLSKAGDLWPRLAPIFKTCVDSKDVNTGLKLVDFYEKANAELAPKMAALLAARWRVAGNPRLNQVDRAQLLRATLAARARAARIAPAERLKQLQALLDGSPLAAGKPDGPSKTAPLPDSVRLAHASTMACILFSKDGAPERFDELIGRIPGSEPNPMGEEKKVEQPPQPGEPQVLDPAAGNQTIQDKLTETSELDPRRDTHRKAYSVRMKAGQIYNLFMNSTELKPYMRIESLAGVQLVDSRITNNRITYSPPADGIYRVVASSLNRKAVGSFTLQIALQPIFRFGFPGNPPQAPAAVEAKAPQLNLSDLADLGHKQGNVRIAAFKNLARSLPNELAYRNARKIAVYLLQTEWQPPQTELEAVTGLLPSVARCRSLLEALADVIASGDKLAQPRTEAIVGGLVGQRLQFARDDDWRSACRKLLLQRALKLTETTTPDASKGADRAAGFLRDLYKEQGLALGLDDPDFQEMTQLAPVLERLVEHVAARTVPAKLAPEEKTYLEQVGRQLRAARFVAHNDLEYAVLLQRIWIKVLVLAVRERAPAAAPQKMLAVQQELDKKDREATNLLDQLRSGEETILRVWALAHDLKLK